MLLCVLSEFLSKNISVQQFWGAPADLQPSSGSTVPAVKIKTEHQRSIKNWRIDFSNCARRVSVVLVLKSFLPASRCSSVIPPCPRIFLTQRQVAAEFSCSHPAPQTQASTCLTPRKQRRDLAKYPAPPQVVSISCTFLPSQKAQLSVFKFPLLSPLLFCVCLVLESASGGWRSASRLHRCTDEQRVSVCLT